MHTWAAAIVVLGKCQCHFLSADQDELVYVEYTRCLQIRIYSLFFDRCSR